MDHANDHKYIGAAKKSCTFTRVLTLEGKRGQNQGMSKANQTRCAAGLHTKQ